MRNCMNKLDYLQKIVGHRSFLKIEKQKIYYILSDVKFNII